MYKGMGLTLCTQINGKSRWHGGQHRFDAARSNPHRFIVRNSRLERKSAKQRRIIIENTGEAHGLTYRDKVWPDPEAKSALGSRLGDRFVDALG